MDTLLLIVCRYCDEHWGTSPKEFVKNLTAGKIKAYFDWIEETHAQRITAASSFKTYWRNLKTYYVEVNGHKIDGDISSDCINISPSSA